MARLFLLSHASTDALRRARFPRDEPLCTRGRRELARADVPPVDRACTAPELRARETAAAVGWPAAVTPGLRDLDHGAWAGSGMDEVPEADLARWLTCPEAAPHGGESIVALLARVGVWLDGLLAAPDRIGAVTHPAVIRAAVVHALAAPASAFWRIDVAPLDLVRMTGRDGRWTLRAG